MAKVTACVITKNEEKNIVKWLQCMKKITKDLVVVDTGSNDRTVEIAKENGGKVYFFEWQKDFAAAKNFAINKAKGDWIIFLDADEYFTDQSIRNVRKYIELYNNKQDIDALICKIINVDADDYNRYISEFFNLRIFRNKPEIRYERPVHERVIKRNGQLQSCILSEDVEIYHIGYSSKIIEKKLQRNLQIILAEIAEVGEQPQHYRYLCECYYGLRDYNNAEKYGLLHVKFGERSLGKDNSIHKRLLECMILLNRPKCEILRKIDEFMKAFSDDQEFLWYKAKYFFHVKSYCEAEKYFIDFITKCEIGKKIQDFSYSSIEPKLRSAYFSMAIISEYKGNENEAIGYYQMGLLRQKYNAIALGELLRILSGKPDDEIISKLTKIYTKNLSDIKFINKVLEKYPNSAVYCYYKKILRTLEKSSNQNEDINEMFANKKYEIIDYLLKLEIKEYYQILLLSVMMDADIVDGRLKPLLTAEYYNVYQKFQGKYIELQENEVNILKNIYDKFIKIKNSRINDYIDDETKLLSDMNKTELVNCIRKLDKESNDEVYCQKIYEFYFNKKVSQKVIIKIIDEMISDKAKVILKIAMYFYQQGKVNETLRLMIAAFKKYPQSEDIIYSLALFLKLSGDKISAIKVLKNYQGTRADIIQLREDFNKL